jgi:hypothetical protein
VKPVVPKKAKPVEGELTTFPGTHVTVLPSGEVVVKKIGLTKEDKAMGMSDSDCEEFNSDEEVITWFYLHLSLSLRMECFTLKCQYKKHM